MRLCSLSPFLLFQAFVGVNVLHSTGWEICSAGARGGREANYIFGGAGLRDLQNNLRIGHRVHTAHLPPTRKSLLSLCRGEAASFATIVFSNPENCSCAGGLPEAWTMRPISLQHGQAHDRTQSSWRFSFCPNYPRGTAMVVICCALYSFSPSLSLSHCTCFP